MNLIREDDPKYKIIDKGASALSDVEALSIIISGQKPIEKARAILSHCSYNFNEVAKLDYFQMKRMGLSQTQAKRIMASTEYSRRKNIHSFPDKFQIKCSKDVADYIRPYIQNLNHEEFWIILLNRNNKILKSFMVSSGGTSGTVTDVKMIYKKAIDILASGLIICHNHPSGNLNPSDSDKKITERIKDAGKMMDIQLLDHVIIAEKEYFSFADDGLI